MDHSAVELIERVAARRTLPLPAERRLIRERAGVSLRDMAGAVGVSHATVVLWEKGARPRNPQHIATYGKLLAELKQIGLSP